jgi:DNA-binding SARP family transcriptional activator
MDIKMLGPLEIIRYGRPVTPTANKIRQVLAMLAVDVGELVTIEAMTEELWGANPPRSATQTLQTYIMRLRRLGEDDPPSRAPTGKRTVVTRPRGYVLDIDPAAIDVHHYEELAAAGRRAAAAEDYLAASRLFATALDRWRGPALVDLRVGPLLSIEVARLTQSRLGVLESRIDADLRLGRQHLVLDELTELTARYPMHESLCAQYMTALHRSGCTWRALEAFRTLRARLVAELGVEPSAQVRQLQMAILHADEPDGRLAGVELGHRQPA